MANYMIILIRQALILESVLGSPDRFPQINLVISILSSIFATQLVVKRKLKDMKTLSDGEEVAARTYYYLLDYMDRHWGDEPLYRHCSKERLMDTTISEYTSFFEKAVDEDLANLKNRL